MKFIVPPQDEHQNRPPTVCSYDVATTMCALCSEDPRFCDVDGGPVL